MASTDLSIIAGERSGSAFKGALARVAAEIRRRVNESASQTSTDYFLACLKALAAIKGNGHLELRITSLYDCAVFFYFNGRGEDAIHANALCKGLSLVKNDINWMRKVYHLDGMILGEIGRIADSVIAYASALELARKMGDRHAEAKTLINVGVLFNYGSFYREAIPCFESALKKLDTNSHELDFGYGAALSNLAQSHYFLGNFEEGYKLVQAALRHPNKSHGVFSSSSLTVREFIAFQLSIELGDLKSAKTHLERCASHAVGSGGRSAFVAQVARGLYETYAVNTETGLALLTDALKQSGNAGAYYEEALAALVRAYDRIGEPELALEHMQLLLSHLTSLRGRMLSIVEGSAPDGDDSPDLGALHLKESRLRTKVALNSAWHSQVEMLERLAVTADLKEEASGEHGYRVGRLSALIGEKLGWPREACQSIDFAARLHDIGKIAMPDRILLTSEQLKEAERHLMSTHTLVGAELLAKSNSRQLQMAEEIARFHHEWWNGEGYPTKRREKRIPIHARIVALADVFDALTHGRPFAEPWSMDRALDEIQSRRGTQFDPELTDVFVALVAHLRAEHADLDSYLGKAGLTSPFLQARHKIRLMLADHGGEALPSSSQSPEPVH